MSKTYKKEAKILLRPIYIKGLSRHAAKKTKLDDGTSLAKRVITSEATFEKYADCLACFFKWCSEQAITIDKTNMIDTAKKYLLKKLATGDSVYTLRTSRAAISKAYGVYDGREIVELPKVTYSEIKRERGEAPERVIKAREKHRDIVMLVEATGIRLRGAKAIEAANLIEYDGMKFVAVREKGGRIRACPIIAEDDNADAINQMLSSVESGKIIKYVPDNLWMHDLRARFAAKYYCLIERDLNLLRRDQLYIRRNGEIYDRYALGTVAVALGHGSKRLKTIVRSYTHRIPEVRAELEKLDDNELEKLRKLASDYEKKLRKMDNTGYAARYFKENIVRKR